MTIKDLSTFLMLSLAWNYDCSNVKVNLRVFLNFNIFNTNYVPIHNKSGISPLYFLILNTSLSLLYKVIVESWCPNGNNLSEDELNSYTVLIISEYLELALVVASFNQTLFPENIFHSFSTLKYICTCPIPWAIQCWNWN